MIDKVLGEVNTAESIVAQEYEYFEQQVKRKIKAYHSLMSIPQDARTELQAIEERFKE